MSLEALQSVDYIYYWTVASALLGDDIVGAVLDRDGRLIWSSAEVATDSAARQNCDKLLSDYFQLDMSEHFETLQQHALHHFYQLPVSDSLEKPQALLILISKHPLENKTFDIVNHLTSCFRTEYLLHDELSAMADEISERYEELHLVYDTEDQIDNFTSGQEALQRLLKNCTEYLDIDVAALILPELHIDITVYSAGLSIESAPRRPENINLAIKQLSIAEQSIVINTPQQASVKGISDYPNKIVACPVWLEHNKLAGILVTANNPNKLDFSNSDRNLIDVMSRKVSKIVQSGYDQLTGLINRHSFEKCIQSLGSRDSAGQYTCLLIIDIDKLHVINDLAGFAAGDQAICLVAKIIRQRVEEQPLIGRIGSNQFGVLLTNTSLIKAELIAKAIRYQVQSTDFTCGDQVFEISVSCGISPIGATENDVECVLAVAETACGLAKKQGRNHIHVLASDDSNLLHRREMMAWIGKIREAFNKNLFCLHAQRIQPISPGARKLHYEVLIRLEGPDGKMIPPGLFLPAAETYDLMPQLDRWVINETLSLLSKYQWALEDFEVCIAINLSGQSVGDLELVNYIAALLDKHSIPGCWVCFEITESVAIANMKSAHKFISAMKRLGCQFSLDDFGTGLSSFEYLRDFDVDFLKIDGTFVKDIYTDPINHAMVSAINQVGHVMGLETIAEFVEDDQILHTLEGIGVNYAQGYGVSKPRAFEQQLDELLNLEPVPA